MARTAGGLLVAVACLTGCAAKDGSALATSDASHDDPVGTADGLDGLASVDASAGPTAGPWYQSAVFYQVFVRSFRDSDGDGIGDLRGLTASLDYLNDGVAGAGQDLEVNALWLLPVFASPSNHGYDVADYDAVNPAYGSAADLDTLIAACKARGIRVVLDLPINHTSDQHPWFVAAASGHTTKRDWYVWRDVDPGWQRPFSGGGPVWHAEQGSHYYGLFSERMPDLNFRTPAVQDAVIEVAKRWQARGVGGFRLDAVRYLVESEEGDLAAQAGTHDVLEALRAALQASDADTYLVGEAWAARSEVVTYHGSGRELHQAFDFDLMGALERSGRQAVAAWVRGEVEKASSQAAPWSYEATFAGNHDVDRLAFRVGDTGQRAIATMLMTLPGSPYIYYGDEYGMRMSLAGGDDAKRAPMAWDATGGAGFSSGEPWTRLSPRSSELNVATQLADPDSLLNHYRALIRLRHEHPVLVTGGVKIVELPDVGLYVALRYDEAAGKRLLVIVNLDTKDAELTAADLSPMEDLMGSGPWTPTPVYGQSQGAGGVKPFGDLKAVPLGGTLSAGRALILKM